MVAQDDDAYDFESMEELDERFKNFFRNNPALDY